MALFPGELIPWIEMRWLDEEGTPLAGGLITFFQSGSSFGTLQDTYSDADLTIANPNPIMLDAGGRSPTSIYLLPTGYDIQVQDADLVTVYTIVDVENVGQTFVNTLGTVLAEGGKNVTSGYAVLVSDRMVTVDSTGGDDPCVINLLPLIQATQPLGIKNLGNIAVSIVPNGTDTIDTTLTSWTLAVAATPIFPTVVLVPDQTAGTWWVRSYYTA